ncbi:MAG: TIGR04190 family B12-binding domain/radical SAM domain protein [Candidatus Bipolaricaulota bacterium]|nr:TIGR04190 family B12-binding domain/radical SAM domain protein [Candidatus Bipolaricaulota bacterium]
MKADVVFLHPPSIFDFRERPILWGPINDLVPSKSVFEMYPIGFVSLASTLDSHGFEVRIVNLALKMLRDENFSPENYIKGVETELFAIDLHWLPHVHGAIELARLCKEIHPDTPIVLGGLSASYYHEEILESIPEVDFVVRGDATEYPMLELVRELKNGSDFGAVPNLTFRSDSSLAVNDITSVPEEIDSFSLDYEYVFRSVLKTRNLDILPFQEFLTRPIMAVLTRKGCDQNCPGCGGSSYSYSKVCNRSDIALRSPKKVVKDLKNIEEFQTPAFVIGDLAFPDEEYGLEIFRLLEDEGLSIPVVFEFFTPPGRDFLMKLGETIKNFSVEMSPESGIEEIRVGAGRRYTNDELKRSINWAFEAGCSQFDLYFMIGLNGQTGDTLEETLEFIDGLLEKHADDNLVPFISPYTPFLDPGSLAFEFPEKYGFTKYAETLMDHYELLDKGFTWKDFLSYRTDKMSKEDLVKVTYESALKLARIKKKHGLISPEKLEDLTKKISVSKRMIRISDARDSDHLDEDQLETSLTELEERLLIDRGELDWSNGITARRVLAVLKKGVKTLLTPG